MKNIIRGGMGLALAGCVYSAPARPVPPRPPVVPSAAAAPVAPAVAPTGVLFVGNSLTFCNALPEMVRAMFTARRQPVQTAQHAIGAATLQEHAQNPAVAQRIAGSKWSHVVLQDQSMLPTIRPEETLASGKILCDQARKAGAVPVFYLTWGYENKAAAEKMDVAMQWALAKAYEAAAREGHAVLAPVGPAWQEALKRDQTLQLYVEDGIHPTAEGTYLAACVFYAVLSGKSPLGLPARIVAPLQGRQVILADVPPARARFYQEVAWDTTQHYTFEKLTAEQNARQAKLPGVADVKARLKRTMTVQDVSRALGMEPEQSNPRERIYIYRIRDGMALWLTWGPDGAISQCHTDGGRSGAWDNIPLP